MPCGLKHHKRPPPQCVQVEPHILKRALHLGQWIIFENESWKGFLPFIVVFSFFYFLSVRNMESKQVAEVVIDGLPFKTSFPPASKMMLPAEIGVFRQSSSL
jgi:hypothetical protein